MDKGHGVEMSRYIKLTLHYRFSVHLQKNRTVDIAVS